MTPNGKAKELISEVAAYMPSCLTVDKIRVEYAKKIASFITDIAYEEAYKQGNEIALIRQEYWQQVKAEIEKL